jgi:hypothetical protein
MGKHVVSVRLLTVMITVALVTSMSAGAANAASYSGAVQPAASAVAASSAGAAAAGSGLAPCTKPLSGTDKDCESTSPTVDRWWDATAAASSCIVKWTIDWGDGSPIWTGTFAEGSPGLHLLASHNYNANVFTTYTETVTDSIVSGPCSGAATYVFHFTLLKSALAPTLPTVPFISACQAEWAVELASLGLSLVEVAGLFRIPGGPYVGVLVLTVQGVILFHFLYTCVINNPTSSTESSTASSAISLPPLPPAFAYGISHPGKPFKPSGTVLPFPQITGIYGYQKGPLVYFSLTYANPDNDAMGFGFVGINGAGWAYESHPFSNPSYGIVGKDTIDYPFNLACGTAQQYNSWVEAWIYNSQGLRSYPVEVYLSCTT